MGYCFGLILELYYAMLMAWDGFVADLKGMLPEKIWVENFHLRKFPKCFYNPWARYCVDWCAGVAPGVLQLRMAISFSSELRFIRS